MALKDVTVYIGRFNPFHNGHAHVLRRALETSRLVIVLIGSSGAARNTKNPFTFDERRDMIEKWHLGVNAGFDAQGLSKLRIMPLRDYPYNDALWIRQVQSTVKKVVQDFFHSNEKKEVFITGADRDGSTWYLNAFPQWQLDLVEPFRQDGCDNVSATMIREWLFGQTDIEIQGKMAKFMPLPTLALLAKFCETVSYKELVNEHSFLKKYKSAWAAAPYAPTFVTSDAVVIQSGHVLVVERANMPGRGLWALPGGFLNQAERFRQGAIRELVEETGIRLAEGKKSEELTKQILNGSIHAKEIFDHPDRSLRGRTITTAFLFRLDDTKPLPKVKGMNVPAYEANGRQIVETADAFWLPINEALEQTDRWFEDHLAILEHFVSRADV